MGDLRKRVLGAYQDGSEIPYIVECFSITYEEVKSILIDYKERNRYKRTFTDEFKELIAERDISGIARRQIAVELEINANTVKKACEKFGQALKEKATSENSYTEIYRDFDMTTCPSCDSKDINEVDEKTTFCMACGNEHIHNSDHALKVNWEYID